MEIVKQAFFKMLAGLFGSKKFTASLLYVVAQAITPKLAAIGIDPMPFMQAFENSLPVFLAWLGSQGMVDGVKAWKGTATPASATAPEAGSAPLEVEVR